MQVPVRVGGADLRLTPRAQAWCMPRSLDARTERGAPGGSLSLRADARVDGRFGWFVEAEGKSRGEIGGNVFLDPMGAVRAGLVLETATAAR